MSGTSEDLPLSSHEHKPYRSSQTTTPKTKSQLEWWRHPRAKRVILAGSAVCLIGILSWFVFFRPFITTDDARVATTLVRLAPEGTSGKVIKLNVNEGDRVNPDQILLELDHSVAQAQLSKARAKAQQALQDLKQLENSSARRSNSSHEIGNARALVQSAEADLQLAQIAYDRTFLKSPTPGVVVQKVTEVGNILETNQTAITLADIDHAWISANIEETSISLIKVGQPVTIHVDEGGELTGKVSEIRSATAAQFALIQAENPSGNFTKLVQRIPIKVTLDPHPGKELRSGQSVEIKIRVR